MALPDSLTFAWADEATLDTGPFEEIGISADRPLLFRKVASDQLIERWFHVKLAVLWRPIRKGR